MVEKLSERELASFVCSHVFRNERPVLLVSRADGDWQFLCGEAHSEDEEGRVVGANHIVDRDPRLRELDDLPVDWDAERKAVDAPWIRTPSTNSDEV